jgi:hypothetical protein
MDMVWHYDERIQLYVRKMGGDIAPAIKSNPTDYIENDCPIVDPSE